MNLKERLFLSHLAWKTRPSSIIRQIQKKKLHSFRTEINTSEQSRIRVAAAQLQLKLFKHAVDYVDEMAGFCLQAVKAGARLVVFPENNAYQLLGLLPGIEDMAQKAAPGGVGTEGFKVADIFEVVGPVFTRIAETTFGTLAKGLNIYIVAGSFPYSKDGHVFNRALIFAPDGRLLGTQDKVHLMPIEQTWGFSQGNSFQVFSTPFGGLSAPVCMDASFFETFRVLTALGADIVAVPIANPEEYNEWLALRGIWPRVQESMVYGIKSALVGRLFGFTLTGKAGIFAPLPLTKNHDGIIAEAKSFDKEELVTADLDMDALHELRGNHPYLGDANPAFIQKYFPELYKKNSVDSLGD